RDVASAEETVKAITADGGRAIAVRADVADEHAVAALFDRAEREFGGVDVVVNAAGRLVLSPVADLDLSALDEMHRTNIRGAFVVARQAARRLRPGGSFLGVSTSVVGAQFPAYSAYVASKAAVESMTLILARELRGRDITVNTVAPGPTATD
ncbi:SDR family oxidoreductase, partial [Streptomyces sp. DH1]